jgi:exodeoxyribonuclease V beta subunit
MRPFTPQSIELERQNLVEASAGTGKTYSITFLFLRLLVEKNLDVDQILVVTFTEAATSELRRTVRDRLRQALAALETGAKTAQDEALKNFVESLGEEEAAKARQKLRLAIRDFDQSAIFTIHGFCSRILSENAFESGTIFDVELIADQRPMLEELAQDYWANVTYGASELLVSYLEMSGIKGPESLGNLASLAAAQPDLEYVGTHLVGDESPYVASYKKARRIWLEQGESIRLLLLTDPGLSRNKYRLASLPKWFALLDEFFPFEFFNSTVSPSNGAERSMAPHEIVTKFGALKVAASNKKNHAPLTHEFFDACQELIDAVKYLDAKVLEYKSGFVAYVHDNLKLRKEDRGVQSFDDLLQGMDRALCLEGRSDRLAAAIRGRYKAALIDEFQDTDRVQYRIFSKVYRDTGLPFFLIGDPKQSIYAFRGGDIFSYLQAVRDAEDRTYTLGVNWRTDPTLVDAVSQIFSKVEVPFIYDEIAFVKVKARPDGQDALKTAGKRPAPLQISYLRHCERMGKRGTITKEWAKENYDDMVAADMQRLLNSETLIEKEGESRRVVSGDIAVLVRKNAQATLMQEALCRHGIANVISSEKSVFETDEATELGQILEAIAEPGNGGRVRAALSTVMFGLNAGQINELFEDERAWDWWGNRFRDMQHVWRERGFVQVMRVLLGFTGLEGKTTFATKLLKLPQGERRLTNIRHLTELLHARSQQVHTGMWELLRWFETQREGGEGSMIIGGDAQLRLESDADAVRLVTIHKAKGLEYPIVYLPYLWDGSSGNNQRKEILFHDPSRNYQATVDIGGSEYDDHKVIVHREEIAENMRLLYVAMTRAKHLCRIFWGRFTNVNNSALGYLLHNREGSNNFEQSSKQIKKSSDDEMVEDIIEIADVSNGAIGFGELAKDDGVMYQTGRQVLEKLNCRTSLRPISRPWRMSSFSRMTAASGDGHFVAGQNSPDVFLDDLSDEETSMPLGDFEAGPVAGNCIHDIFEEVDFKLPATDALEKIISHKLDKYGFDVDTWLSPVRLGIIETIGCKLDEEDTVCLGDISLNRRFSELEFVFPLSSKEPVNAGHLAEVLANNDEGQLPPGYVDRLAGLEFPAISGYLKGFIDLVFEHRGRFNIVDYKSNYLGNSYADYDAENMTTAMQEHHYILQYHLYTVALHRYLGRRIRDYDYDSHMGQTYYLFVRGMSAKYGPRFGVYSSRPPRKLVTALSDLFGEIPSIGGNG